MSKVSANRWFGVLAGTLIFAALTALLFYSDGSSAAKSWLLAGIAAVIWGIGMTIWMVTRANREARSTQDRPHDS